MSWTRIGMVAAFLGLGACVSPLHLTYDHGRAYTEAVLSQSDLTRTSVANSNYELYGVEAEAIRIRVQEDATDDEKATSTLEK